MRKSYIFVILLAIFSIGATLSYTDGEAQGHYYKTYSPSQVKKMMRYHGTLAAKFDGQTWWFQKNGRWIRLDTDDAKSRCI
ncbi:MAG: hypothetical protein QME44_01370 [Thermodesulfobacteriota bacterium]|nr:hypothetical protein [Thermodesulfobacteriota bacterium]HEC99193.1 hypothetical protein [Pseudomonadota bacterium]